MNFRKSSNPHNEETKSFGCLYVINAFETAGMQLDFDDQSVQ